jgi:hypothetical protein
MSTSPACAAARAAFAQEGDGDGDELPAELYNALHSRISSDIARMRSGRFDGQRFSDDIWATHLER